MVTSFVENEPNPVEEVTIRMKTAGTSSRWTRTNRCSKCGILATSTSRSSQSPQTKIKLHRCSRCLLVRYCSKECQLNDWQDHKFVCRSNSSSPHVLPPGVSDTPTLLLASKTPIFFREASEAPSKSNGPSSGTTEQADTESTGASEENARLIEQLTYNGFRDVTVQEPSQVVCCCWCCGILLKACGPHGTNPSKDANGPYWTETYGRSDGGASGNTIPGQTFPALSILGRPGSTGYRCAVNQYRQAAACLYCAHQLRQNPQQHLRQCEDWLHSESPQNSQVKDLDLKKLQKCSNWVEKRMLALIALYPNPDLSRGQASIAGRYTRDGECKSLLVPFTYKNIEEQAFPTLFVASLGFKGTTQLELIQYTLMRLYSANPMWRQDRDYVVFSIHRLAAFGVASAQKMVQDLPASHGINEMHDLESCQISLIPGFQ